MEVCHKPNILLEPELTHLQRGTRRCSTSRGSPLLEGACNYRARPPASRQDSSHSISCATTHAVR